MSQRVVGEKYGVHRRTVRHALTSAVPPPRKKPVARATVLDPAKGWIDAMPREDLTAPRKQKHIARRIHQRLAQDYGFDQASYSTVCDYPVARRPQIEAEARERHRHTDGMVTQVHLPGEEAEVDFADVWVRLAGEVVKCHLFTLRMSYSGKAVRRVYASQAQQSFMDPPGAPLPTGSARTTAWQTGHADRDTGLGRRGVHTLGAVIRWAS
ncbi:hypothetical protein [Streptomyces avermitilis]|uniref:hypothetical protein n=1 Tax=Streptomyces avermitilis TaxID=33903 RepID=UPI003696CE72